MAGAQTAGNIVWLNNADGFSIGGGATRRSLVVTAGNITLTGGGVATMTHPGAGISGTFITPDTMFAVTTSDFTLQAASGVQTAFPTTCDVWTLQGSTSYYVTGGYNITCGTTTHTTAIAFLAGGGLTVNSINLQVRGWNSIANTVATASQATWMTQLATTVVTVTATTAGNHVTFWGIIRVNAGGTLTPQIDFSANPTGTNLMKADSYIMFTPLGSNTVELVGNVA